MIFLVKKIQGKFFLVRSLLFFCVLFFGANQVFAEEFTSTDYKISDSVMSAGGGFSSSTDFQLIGSIAQISIGTSTANSFGLNAGFLTWPAPAAAASTAAASSTTIADSGAVLGSFSPIAPFVPFVPVFTERAILTNADLNHDGSVGLKDFSILLSIVNDNTLHPKDLSLLFYRWTEPLLSFKPDYVSQFASSYQSFENKPKENFIFNRPREQAASLGELSAKPEAAVEPKQAVAVPQEAVSGLFNRVKNFVAGIFGRISDFFWHF